MVAAAEQYRTATASRRTPHAFAGDSAVETTAVGDSTLTYDNNGNQTQDQNGYQYTYDAWNQLVAVTDADGNWVVGYVYDGLGRRVEEVTETLTEGGAVPEVTDVFYSTSWQILQEGGGADGTDDGRTVKVWSPVFVNALAEERTTTLNTTTTQVMTTDTSFSITAEFDTSGVNLGRVSYNSWDGAFGQATYYLSDSAGGGAFATTTSAGLTTTGWQGGEFDSLTNDYVFDHRIYFVTQRRWGTAEPSLGAYIDGVNLYESDANNPLNVTDFTGLDAVLTSMFDKDGSPQIRKGEDGKYVFFYKAIFTFAGVPAGSVLVQHNETTVEVGNQAVGAISHIIDVTPIVGNETEDTIQSPLQAEMDWAKGKGNACKLTVTNDSVAVVGAGAQINIAKQLYYWVNSYSPQPRWVDYSVVKHGFGELSKVASTFVTLGNGLPPQTQNISWPGSTALVQINDARIKGPDIMSWTHHDELEMQYDPTAGPGAEWKVTKLTTKYSSANPAVNLGLKALNHG